MIGCPFADQQGLNCRPVASVWPTIVVWPDVGQRPTARERPP